MFYYEEPQTAIPGGVGTVGTIAFDKESFMCLLPY